MVENIYIKKGETFEKKILFEGLDYLRSITSCGCTATKQIEVKNEGFEATISYKGSKAKCGMLRARRGNTDKPEVL